jgi:hypothetical protein
VRRALEGPIRDGGHARPEKSSRRRSVFRFSGMNGSPSAPAGGDSRRAPDGHSDEKAGRTGISLAEIAGGLILAVFLTALVDGFTGLMPPKWDPEVYTDMARNGVLHNDHLVAPYAYRPAMPLLAGALARALDAPLSAAFLWITRSAVAALLFAAFLLARRFAGSAPRAVLPVLFAATAVMPVKFALFVPASVDAAAYPLMVLAVWAFASGRTGLSLWISALGLFFKEFLAIPLVLSIAEYARAWRRTRTPRALRAFAGAIVLGLAAILIPRLGLTVIQSQQEIDPLNNIRSLSRLVANPLNLGRDLNIALCLLAFWLPVLLLATRARIDALKRDLAPLRHYLAGFMALNLLLVMYGGTNLLTFVSYAIPLQILVLARFAAGGPHAPRPVEWVLALACTAAYNRVFGTIPLPDDGFDAYIDYYSGWSDRVNLSTLRRFLEIAVYLGVMQIGRRLASRNKAG